MKERRPYAMPEPMWAVATAECVAQTPHLWVFDDYDCLVTPACGVTLFAHPADIGRESPHGNDKPRCKRCEKWLRDRPNRFPHLDPPQTERVEDE